MAVSLCLLKWILYLTLHIATKVKVVKEEDMGSFSQVHWLSAEVLDKDDEFDWDSITILERL